MKADLEPSDPTPHLRDEDSAIERGSDLSRSMCEEPTGFREKTHRNDSRAPQDHRSDEPPGPPEHVSLGLSWPFEVRTGRLFGAGSSTPASGSLSLSVTWGVGVPHRHVLWLKS